MDHLSRARLALRRKEQPPFRGPPSTSGIESFHDGGFPPQARRVPRLNNDGWCGRVRLCRNHDMVTNKIVGADLQTALFERVTKQVRLSCSVEVSPDPNNRVELSSTLVDF